MTISAGTGGSVSPTSIANVPYGTTINVNADKLTINGTTVTATANNKYTFNKWSVNNGAKVTSAMTITATFKENSCIAEGTLITMGDGSLKPVEELRVGDMVMTWSFWNGCFEAQPVLLLWNHGLEAYHVLSLLFSDGSSMRIINEHSLYDADLNDYAYITQENVSDFYGHHFVKFNNDGTKCEVTLVDSVITEETVGCYSVRTAYNENSICDGILAVTPRNYLFFDVHDNMIYDSEAMARDIALYGLFTYEEWSDYCTEAEFNMVNAKYYKILIGKGIITLEELLRQISERP